MNKVIVDVSVSIDGYIAGPNDTIGTLHDWMFVGDRPGKDMLAAALARVGAVVMGRRTFDMVDSPEGWKTPDGTPLTAPVFVLVREARPSVGRGATPFHFVADGIGSAVAQAKAASGGRDVSLMGACIIQQALNAGLLDELVLHVVPVLFGGGIRLFDNIEPGAAGFEQLDVEALGGVTHVHYRVGPAEPAGDKATGGKHAHPA